MMFETRKRSTLLHRGPTALALAFSLLAFALLVGSDPAAAQALPPIKVYHSPNDDGLDPGPTCPPACSCSGGELIVSGDFETGDLSGWMSTGIVSVVGAGYGTGPIGGSFNALLETGFKAPGGSSTSVTDAEIEAFFGLGAGDLDALTPQGVTQGSAIKQSFTASVGETISFDFVVLADDCDISGCPGGVEDFAFVSILVDGVLEVLATTYGTLAAGSGSPYFAESGVLSFSHTLTTGGTVELGIAVLDGGDTAVPSAILVDNVSTQTSGADCAFNFWIDGGPIASDVEGGEILCKMDPPEGESGAAGGSGHELCGADVLIELTSGPGSFTHFNKDSERDVDTLVHSPACEEFDSETGSCSLPSGQVSVRMNFRRGDSDPPTGPRRLGTLVVGGADFSGTTELAASYVAGAGAKLQLRLIPEPGRILMLVSGLFGLGFLYRLRRRP
jgi:hypothetical protein